MLLCGRLLRWGGGVGVVVWRLGKGFGGEGEWAGWVIWVEGMDVRRRLLWPV